jgi:hypothetical protein
LAIAILQAWMYAERGLDCDSKILALSLRVAGVTRSPRHIGVAKRHGT